MTLCHDPSDCLTYSNCTGITDCEPYQRRLYILDTIVFNKFLQTKCSNIVGKCCVLLWNHRCILQVLKVQVLRL